MQLTPRLLGFLIKRGYKYFLSHTSCIDQEDAYIGITLKPVKKHPLLHKLPQPYKAYCNVVQQPALMAMGIINTVIMVELGVKDTLKAAYYNN